MQCFYPVMQPNGISRPCGQCQACMISKQLQWKFRLKQEVLSNDFAFWLTLQYDDEHLPLCNDLPVPCVKKIHCQDYFRQIRKGFKCREWPLVMKYFLVSEYGPQTHRPHYHCLLLLKLTAKVDSKLALRQAIYDFLKERWYHGHVQESLFHSGVVGYLTKYVFKDQDKWDPPVKCFRLISKGIGVDYTDKVDKVGVLRDNWRTPYGLLPRYYRDKLFPRPKEHYTDIYSVQSRVNDKVLDALYKKVNREVKKAGSVEAYERRQKYLADSYKLTIERKIKQKYG